MALGIMIGIVAFAIVGSFAVILLDGYAISRRRDQ